MNSDRRSYCRIFTHYAVQTFTFADLPIATTYRSVFALSSSRIRQDLLYPFLSTFCFVSVFTVCLFTNVSFFFFWILLCLKCPIIFLEFYRFNAQLLTSFSDFVQKLFRTARLSMLFLDRLKQLRSAFFPLFGPSAGKLISGQIHLCILSTQCRTLQSDQVGRLNTHSLTKAKNPDHTGRV